MLTTTLFGFPAYELVGMLQEAFEEVTMPEDEVLAFTIGKYHVCVNGCVVLVCDERYELMDFAILEDTSDLDESFFIDSICSFVATRSGISQLLAVLLETGRKLHVKHEDVIELYKQIGKHNPKWIAGFSADEQVCERRKVLFTHGMGNDRMLIITDAPKEAIEAWCRRCVAEMENGENTYFDTLKSQYYVRELLDSEEHDIEDVEIIGYDEEYELTDYYDFSDE